MLAGGHPHDRWVVDTAADGSLVPRGNPARCADITQIMLSRIITFLKSDSMFNETMRVWFSAVCSLSFYGMCRINEVL
ncbi:hypothetical protein JG688_00017901 [Phytophthora aleatoria]|uniref:Uncharacterized protein n=1 Tax=Phytophthora aleatoria TaxID=2496075 RepID=A0A8J5IQ67_9STRA|nr:hypothetical protein JG688_00017901 [Phytophthora aleatoria]